MSLDHIPIGLISSLDGSFLTRMNIIISSSHVQDMMGANKVWKVKKSRKKWLKAKEFVL